MTTTTGRTRRRAHVGTNGDGPPIVVGRPPLTDYGNAERLIARHGADLRYVDAWGKWLVWDGCRWREDLTREVERRAKQTVRKMVEEEAATIADDDERRSLIEHSLHSESEHRIAAMIALARSESGIPVTPNVLDADPWALNVLNGTINLHTGQLRPHDRTELITKLAPVAYDPAARLDLWESFLATASNEDPLWVPFLQRASGYSATGDVREEKIFMAIGDAATGKSTFAEALKNTLGDYAATADFETFLARRDVGGPRNDIARLAGARLVLSSEVDRGKRLAEGLLKMITGGDTVTARFLYREAFEFRPMFKPWLMANHAPKVRDDDAAMWRRILRVPFNHVIAPGKRDPAVKATLRNPVEAGPAILAWIVEGCRAWRREGLGVPPAVEQATVEYRDEMNPLRDFYADKVVFEPDAWMLASDLRKTYLEWAEAAGERYPLTVKELGECLRVHGCVPDRRNPGRGWSGVRLRTLCDPHPADENTSGSMTA